MGFHAWSHLKFIYTQRTLHRQLNQYLYAEINDAYNSHSLYHCVCVCVAFSQPNLSGAHILIFSIHTHTDIGIIINISVVRCGIACIIIYDLIDFQTSKCEAPIRSRERSDGVCVCACARVIFYNIVPWGVCVCVCIRIYEEYTWCMRWYSPKLSEITFTVSHSRKSYEILNLAAWHSLSTVSFLTHTKCGCCFATQP